MPAAGGRSRLGGRSFLAAGVRLGTWLGEFGNAAVALLGSGSNEWRVPSRSRVKASTICAESSGTRKCCSPSGELILEFGQTLPNAQVDHGHAVTLALTVDAGRAIRLWPVLPREETVVDEDRTSGLRSGPVVQIKQCVTSHAASLSYQYLGRFVMLGLRGGLVRCAPRSVGGDTSYSYADFIQRGR